MNILGLSYNYHDAAACLLRDGAIVAAAEEERFSRVKHDARFPDHAIRYCLHAAGLKAHDIDCVAFYEKPARKLERALQIAKRHAPASMDGLAAQYPRLIEDGFSLPELLAERIGYTGRIVYSEHHLSHASSAFYASPFAEAAILVADGVGEWATTSEFRGMGNTVTPLREIHYPHSLGLLYATLTAFLGFRVNDDEYKVMGLASYGAPRFRKEIERLIALHTDGSFTLALEHFAYMHDAEKMFTPALTALLGPLRLREAEITERHRDIAASLQAVTEDAIVALAKSARAATASRHLCLAGGVALNCVANSQVLARAGFDDLFVQPAAGDSGTAMGAALWAHHDVFGAARNPGAHDTLLGPSFSDDAIRESLARFGVAFEEVDDDALCRRTAEAIGRGLIVGWFQGRMEFGPRALGSRSILANPCLAEMKDVLNARVKFREDFRPFAPAVLEERAKDYFEMTGTSPYMLLTPRVRDDQAARIPSVTHVDGTARVQTVSRDSNPLFHRLIAAFGAVSGVPIVINTSFNVRGEPIVCTPDDAVRCFLGTDIDMLAIGHFLVTKGA